MRYAPRVATCRLFPAFLLLIVHMVAQATSTEIVRTVADASFVIPNVRVSLLRAETGERGYNNTTSARSHAFPLVEVGAYTQTVEVKGFETR